MLWGGRWGGRGGASGRWRVSRNMEEEEEEEKGCGEEAEGGLRRATVSM